MTARDFSKMGLEGLALLRSEYGFNASDMETGQYPGLFGRDSLWSVLLLADAVALGAGDDVKQLACETGIATLTALAALQGTRVDDRVEEQPGKILHEYHLVPSPHVVAAGVPLSEGRSFAGFDETFLFILAYASLGRLMGGTGSIEHLWPNVERALAWINDFADADRDGLFEYQRRDPRNLLNQVWKDSFDAATHTGFDVPPQPVAWLEIQGYAYAVHLAMARLCAASESLAQQHRARADELAERVDKAFWLNPEEGYAMAVDGNKVPIRMVSSNPGHALWAGIIPATRAEQAVLRISRPDLTSAFGVRTLATSSSLFAPFAYHRGAIWPFDNAVLAVGLHRYGYVNQARDLARSVGIALLRAGTPVECYVALEPELFIPAGTTDEPTLCWHTWPLRNRVQAFTSAALVVFGALLQAGGE